MEHLKEKWHVDEEDGLIVTENWAIADYCDGFTGDISGFSTAQHICDLHNALLDAEEKTEPEPAVPPEELGLYGISCETAKVDLETKRVNLELLKIHLEEARLRRDGKEQEPETDWLEVCARLVWCMRDNGGTYFGDHWKNYGITKMQQARILDKYFELGTKD